jgi:hypothetical protein
LPSGDVFDLYPGADQFDHLVAHIDSVDEVISMTSNRLTAYSAEALIHRFLAKRPVTPEEHARLRSANVGLNQFPVLRNIREYAKQYAEATGSATEEGSLLLWGTHSRPARSVHGGIGLLLKSLWIQPHLASYPEYYQHYDIRDLLFDWARACGVNHWRTEQAIYRRFLGIAPNGAFVRLGQGAADLTLSVCPSNRFLAVYFFRCLQRIAAYQWRGYLFWPSAWLRGTGKSANAIKGASGSSRALTALLKQFVLERVEGHCAGKRAATYRLRLSLPTGTFDVRDFAAMAGVEVDESGVPRRSK